MAGTTIGQSLAQRIKSCSGSSGVSRHAIKITPEKTKNTQKTQQTSLMQRLQPQQRPPQAKPLTAQGQKWADPYRKNRLCYAANYCTQIICRII